MNNTKCDFQMLIFCKDQNKIRSSSKRKKIEGLKAKRDIFVRTKSKKYSYRD